MPPTHTLYQDIFQAAEKNDLDAVKYFVEQRKIPLTETDHRLSQTAAHIVAKNGNLNILQYLLEKEPELISTEDFYGNKIFFLAIENNHIDIVKFLVKSDKVDILEHNERCFDNTAVHRAAEFGHLDILQYFMDEKNGQVEVLNKYKQTPVFLAAQNKHHHVIRYLVEQKKANLDVIDSSGQHILYLAVDNSDMDLIKYVLDERKIQIDIDYKDNFGDTLTHRAAALNRLPVLKYLVDEKHANISIVDKWRQTPLQSAVKASHYAVCKFLIEHGADVDTRDDLGRYPIQDTMDERIINLIKSASKNRTRRSTSISSVSDWANLPNLVPHELTQRIAENSAASSEARLSADVQSGSSNLGDSLQLDSLLVLTSTIAQYFWQIDLFKEKRVRNLSEDVLKNKMDFFAIEAIKSVPDFE